MARNYVFLILSLTLFVSGCLERPGGSVLKSLDVNQDHAIVIGRIRIRSGTTDITAGAEVFFFRNPNGDYKYGEAALTYKLDSSGYFAASLPLADYRIDFIAHPSQKGLIQTFWAVPEPGDANFALEEHGVAYYIGDLSVDWIASENRSTAFIKNVLTWGLLEPSPAEETAVIRVENKIDDIKAWFAARYGNNVPIKKVLVRGTTSKKN